MPRVARLLSRYRFLVAALAASLALHAAVFVTLPARFDSVDNPVQQPFSAQLLPPAPVAAPAEVKPPAPRKPPPRAHRTLPKPPPPAPAPMPQVLAAATPAPELPLVPLPTPEPPAAAAPGPVAVAEPILPWLAPLPEPAPEPELFPMEGLPARLSIDYQLRAGPLSAHAVYRWRRDGDSYRITGEGEAVGLFRLFVDGNIVQESEGTITTAGLRPERFIERRPGSDDEGLQFDWLKHVVTLEHGASRKTAPLTGETVDWLSMIFQLAHMPPRDGGELNLRVFTQRKLYDFDLKVVGVEEIEIPLGTVRALHLRHVDPDDGKAIDVWLGVDQHYLPVKMRYPVAKMQFMVEQSAAKISER